MGTEARKRFRNRAEEQGGRCVLAATRKPHGLGTPWRSACAPELGKPYTTAGAHSDSASSLVLQADHKIVVAGGSTDNGNNELHLLRYNSDGSLDTSFNGTGVVATGPLNAGNAVVLQADGSIVVAGGFPVS